MTKAKSKRKPASRANDSKTKTRNSVKRTTARKIWTTQVRYRASGSSAAARPRRSRLHAAKAKRLTSLQCCERQVASTIEAMARAAKWQPHSVRGFLAGVVRKKLGLTLVSADGENGRVYRITDRTASAAA